MASNIHCGRTFFYKLLQVPPVSHITISKFGGGKEEMAKFKPTQINCIPKKISPFMGKKRRSSGKSARGGKRCLANSQGRNHDSSKLSEGTEWDCICLESTFRPKNALWSGKAECCPATVTTDCKALGKTTKSLRVSVFSSLGDHQDPIKPFSLYLRFSLSKT